MVGDLLIAFDVRPPATEAPLRTLSGGNQQKALLAKWLQLEPKILLLHEPSQGVDVGAKREIFQRIERAAETGAAVLIASAEFEDLAHLCQRVLVIADGVIVSSSPAPMSSRTASPTKPFVTPPAVAAIPIS